MNVELNSDCAPLKVGEEFLKYEIRALLGHGDHAWVYEAHDPLLDRVVALKLIPEPPNSKRDLVQRSLEQGPLLRDLHHSNLVSVFDVGTIGDHLVYIVMERLLGQTLRSALVERRQLTPLEVLPIGIQVAEGMAWAHVLQVIHRDLKPENVFLTENSEVKVLNTGITSFIVPSVMTTERDWVRGTLLYMSPEHVQGYGVTGRSDIYSLGTLLYECLAGKAPILFGEDRPNLEALTWRQISQMPAPLEELVPGVPGHLSRIIQQMLAKEAVLRFGTMDEVAVRLRESNDRLLAESGASNDANQQQRPYIVFPCSALGMKAAAVPDAGPAEKDVVAGAARLLSAAAAAKSDHKHERTESTPSKPDAAPKKPRRRVVLIAVALGAVAGVAIALMRTGASSSEQPDSPSGSQIQPATGNQQPSSPGTSAAASIHTGPSVASPSERPTRVEASLGAAKNQNKPDTYEHWDAGAISSRRPDAQPVIGVGKSGTREQKSRPPSPASGQLVF